MHTLHGLSKKMARALICSCLREARRFFTQGYVLFAFGRRAMEVAIANSRQFSNRSKDCDLSELKSPFPFFFTQSLSHRALGEGKWKRRWL